MANGSFQFSATSSDLQRALGAATQKARQQYGSGRVVTQDFVQDPQTGMYTGTIVYEPTPQEEKDATLDMVKRALVEDARANGTVTPTLASTDTQAPAPDTVRNVRNNNPGNLRTGDVETAQRYYGEDAVTGVDEGGFAQFSSPEAGISALQQQVRVDTNRGLNLGEFLNKYTPESDDPSGNKAAKTNIPKLVNANLDTPLENINPTELVMAITRQEGGDEALQAFGSGIRKPAPTLADIERGAANVEKMAREREVETRFGRGSTPAPQDRIVSRDSAMLGMPTQGTTVRQDDELTKRLVGDNIDENDDYGSLPITSFQEAPSQPRRGRAASRDAELEQRANVTPTADAIVRGTTRGGRAIGSKPSLLDVGMTQKQGRVGRGRNEALTYGGQQTEEPGLDGSLGAFPGEKDEPEYRERLGDADPIAKRAFEKQDRESSLQDLVAGMDTTQRRSTDPRAQLSTERAEEGEISPVSEGVEVGLLSRIGKAITDNPELAASGAQLLGGLISNAAQNRAQRRADRTTDQRVARANLISAITGGRARPTVERAQADTGGFLSLDTLGKAFQGGGAAYKSELARQVEEGERERKAKLEERGMKASELGVKSLDDYRKATLAFNEKKFDKETQLAAEQNVVDYLKAAKDLNASERLPIKEIGELSSELASLKRLDNLEDFIIDADFSFLEMGPLRLEEPSQFIFGSDARVAESAIQGLIAEVAKTIPGVLTEGDQKRLETRLLSLNDTESTALDVAQAFREELLVKFEERLGALKGSGRYDTTYFDDRLMEYRQGRGAQGFESMLTKDEIVLGR